MFSDKTVYELKTICMMYDIEYPKTAKKAEIIEAIEKAGITIEKYEKDLDGAFDVVEQVKEEKELVVKTKEEVSTTKQKNILLKMIHPRGALNVGNGVVFTIEEPFKSLSEEKANDILRKAKNEVREATPEEAAMFYGVTL